MRIWAIAVLMLLVPTGSAMGAVREENLTLQSGGKPVTVEAFSPQEGKHPAILVLHGSDGLSDAHAAGYRLLCRELASKGYLVLFPHYFERTGTLMGGPAENVKNWPAWVQTIEDAVAKAKTLEQSDGGKVGIVGFSLGSYLGLSVSTQEADVAAMVDFFGGMPRSYVGRVKTMPPVLILHGDADKLVSVDEAYKLEQLLKEKKLPYEMKIYPGQGHGFTGEARLDSAKRAMAFLEEHLKRQ